ncbi:MULTISPECIES: hypothetical protein [Myxococcus]|uniref:hypothetical protein n=1 Tax=Myxococcus TaxID=32 RepID=UPI001142A129|nr:MULTISPECIES: hypothetical protein [Myxococcus]NOK01699.1 hypothetical protein [Myxococcus xanthus]
MRAPMFRRPSAARRAVVLATAWVLGCGRSPSFGEREPFIPRDTEEVLARVPAVGVDARARERAALRKALAGHAGQLDMALRLARLEIEASRVLGEPRYLGRAQAALRPWWDLATPPPGVRLVRATFHHARRDFPAALEDLDAVVKEDPGNVDAWLLRAEVLGIRGEHAEAARSCARLTALTSSLTVAVCEARVRSLAGHSRKAHALLSEALRRSERSQESRTRALATLAEAAALAGDAGLAERYFLRAISLDSKDYAARAAYADLLLDAGRAREAAVVVMDHTQDDRLLLRHALAENALGSSRAPEVAHALSRRFEESRLRGDSLLAREEARFALQVENAPEKALRLAQAVWVSQREPWDVRLLIEAALAAGRPEAARPALDFLQASGCEDPGLVFLAERVRSLLP